jgi:hypothetical protein
MGKVTVTKYTCTLVVFYFTCIDDVILKGQRTCFVFTFWMGRLKTASTPMTRTDSSILDRLLSSPSPLNLSAASAVNPIVQQLHCQNARYVIFYPSPDDLTMATYIL